MNFWNLLFIGICNISEIKFVNQLNDKTNGSLTYIIELGINKPKKC